MIVDIYTDGACSGNPGIGGWGVVILIPNREPVYINGGLQETTNNQMELTATIKALQYFKDKQKINIYTDSQYVMNGINSWIINWKNNGWKTASKKTVKNKELWLSLDIEIAKHNINWHWIKGHAGNINNEKADFLARKFINEF